MQLQGDGPLRDAPATTSPFSARKPVLLFTDADILCPATAGDDAAQLAASFVVGIAAAAEKGIGVVVTAFDQFQVNCSVPVSSAFVSHVVIALYPTRSPSSCVCAASSSLTRLSMHQPANRRRPCRSPSPFPSNTSAGATKRKTFSPRSVKHNRVHALPFTTQTPAGHSVAAHTRCRNARAWHSRHHRHRAPRPSRMRQDVAGARNRRRSPARLFLLHISTRNRNHSFRPPSASQAIYTYCFHSRVGRCTGQWATARRRWLQCSPRRVLQRPASCSSTKVTPVAAHHVLM